jgi:hypothetical protein
MIRDQALNLLVEQLVEHRDMVVECDDGEDPQKNNRRKDPQDPARHRLYGRFGDFGGSGHPSEGVHSIQDVCPKRGRDRGRSEVGAAEAAEAVGSRSAVHGPRRVRR